MLNERRDRSIYLDMVKGFAILTVVLGHCMQFGSGREVVESGAFFDFFLFKLIYSFHMPLFLLVSGYLFSHSLERNEKFSLMVRKAKTLLIPVAIWVLIPTGIKLSEVAAAGGKITPLVIVKKYISSLITEYWFLWALFWCSLLVFLVRKYLKDSIWIYFLVLAATFVTPDFYNLSLYKFVLPFFVLGYLFGRDDVNEALSHVYRAPLFLGIAAVLFGVMLLFYQRECYIYTSGYCILKETPFLQFGIDVYRFAIGLVGSVFALLLLVQADLYLGEKWKKALALLGRNSIGIYIFSGLIFLYVIRNITDSLDGIRWWITLAELIVITGLTLLLTILVKKVPILDRLLLGGRN